MKLFNFKSKIYKTETITVDVGFIRVQIILNNSKNVIESNITGYITQVEYNSYYNTVKRTATDVLNYKLSSDLPKFIDSSNNLEVYINKDNIDKIIVMENRSLYIDEKVKIEMNKEKVK